MRKIFNSEIDSNAIMASFKPSLFRLFIFLFFGSLLFILLATWSAAEKPQFYHAPGWFGLLFFLIASSFIAGFFMQYIIITEDALIVEAVYSKLTRHKFRTILKFNEIIGFSRVDKWRAGRLLKIKTISQVLYIAYFFLKSSDSEKLESIILSKINQDVKNNFNKVLALNKK
jgi:hypothetical protein